MNSQSITHPAFGLNLTNPALGARAREAAPVSAHEALQARFALRVGAALTQRSAELDADITERLRFAREAALARVQRAATPAAARPSKFASSVARAFPWLRLASVLPAIALVGGLLLIQHWQESAQISVAAEVDAALLSDDLPPNAYGDPGFVEFLKSPGE